MSTGPAGQYPFGGGMEKLFADLDTAEVAIRAESEPLARWSGEEIRIKQGLPPYGLYDQELPRPPEALDGGPYVASILDARAIAETRPDIATNARQFVDRALLIDRQQAAIAMHHLRPEFSVPELFESMSGSPEDYEAQRIEFWAIVSQLHPISQDYIQMHKGEYPNLGHTASLVSYDTADWAVQTERLVELHTELQVLARGLTGEYGISNITRTQERYAADPVTLRVETGDPHYGESLEYMYESAMRKLPRLLSLSRLLSDVLSGEASQGAQTAASESLQTEEASSVSRYEDLKNIPGLNPAQLAVEQRLHEMSQNGWIVEAQVEPQGGGSVTLHRYEEAAQIAFSGHTSARGDSVNLKLELLGAGYGQYAITYGPPPAPDRNIETMPLPNGMTLRGYINPMEAWVGSPNQRFGPTIEDRADFAAQCDDASRHTATPFKFFRITDDVGITRQIVAAAGAAMGMDANSVKRTLDMFAQKKALEPIRSETHAEREARIRSSHPDEEKSSLTIDIDGFDAHQE